MVENVKVLAINAENISDRLKLCWGHFKDWQHLEIVQKSKEWLEKNECIIHTNNIYRVHK